MTELVLAQLAPVPPITPGAETLAGWVIGALVLAVVALAAALVVGVRAGARWLTQRAEAMEARQDVERDAFLDALAESRKNCREELREIVAAFEHDVAFDREEHSLDRAERQKDREASHAIAERTAGALASVQASILRLECSPSE